MQLRGHSLEHSSLLNADRALVEEHLAQLAKSDFRERDPSLPEFASERLLEAIRRLLCSSGKRVRPLLVLWLARHHGANSLREGNEPFNKDFLGLAAAVELLHSASLVIDDIQDGSTERRGQPTLGIEFGVPLALNTASLCYFVALRLIPKLETRDLASRILIECHFGQGLDLVTSDLHFSEHWFKASPAVRIQIYETTALLKTTALMKIAGLGAAQMLGFPPEKTSQLEKILETIGLMFQVIDDVKNLVPTLSGEKCFEDFEAPVRSRVFVSMAEKLTSDEKSFVLDCLRRGERGSVRNLLMNHASLEPSMQECVDLVKKQEQSLHQQVEHFAAGNTDSVRYFQSIFSTQLHVFEALRKAIPL